jgi:hypothetical protein
MNNEAARLDRERREQLWLQRIRDAFDSMLQEFPRDESNKAFFSFVWSTVYLLSIDATLMQALHNALTQNKIDRVEFTEYRRPAGGYDAMFRQSFGLAPLVPEALRDTCVELGNMLGSLHSLKAYTISNVNDFNASSSAIIAGCRQIEALGIGRTLGDFAPEGVAALAPSLISHPSITKLALYSFGASEMRLMVPIIITMSKLSDLQVNCSTNHPWVLSTSVDADMIRDLLGNQSLERLFLDKIVCATVETTKAFRQGIDVTAVFNLALVSFICPESEYADVAKALVKSRLVELFIQHDAPSLAILEELRGALVVSQSTVLEQLRVQHGHGLESPATPLLDSDMDASILDPDRVLDPVWVKEVNRILESNVERRISAPLFAAIGEAGLDGSTRCERAVAALTARSIPILFEHILCNGNDLQDLLVQSNQRNGVLCSETASET